MSTAMQRTRNAVLCAMLGLAAAALAVPFWGDPETQSADTLPGALKPGQFVWNPDAAAGGPILVVASLTEQMVYVYRNGVRIGYAPVSTGKPGHDTPTGVFTTLQKDKNHHSSRYNNAPMPYTQRLTMDGVALHAGGLPGFPSSHGCVHLPSAFAQSLFAASPLGMTVVISKQSVSPEDVVHPATLAPVDPAGAPLAVPRLSAEQAFRWEPEKSLDGPISILLSGSDQRVLVFRNGVEIGRARISVDDPAVPLGTHVFTLLQGADPTTGAAPKWIATGIPGHAGEDKQPLDPAHAARVRMPPEFLAVVLPMLQPGSSMMVTDAPVLETTTGTEMAILTGDPPAQR